MSKSDITRIKLEEALNRILKGQPEVIPPTQKLSVKAVEEEAGLGSGSVYYYKDIVSKIKECSLKQGSTSKEQSLYENKISSLRDRLKKETRLKEKYRSEAEELKDKLANMASQHNQLSLIIQQYQYLIAELESESTEKLSRNNGQLI